MLLIYFLIIAALIGVATWAVTTYFPMPKPVKQVIIGIVVVGLILWALGFVFKPALIAF